MLIINLLGILLIIAIVWWFWLYKPQSMNLSAGQTIITVENGVYSPARIQLPAGRASSLSFLRKDASPCAGTVIFSDFEISEELPVDKIKTIPLPALTPGNYQFGCQMQMYRGELIVI